VKPEKLTVDELQQNRPDLYEQILEAGKAGELERFEVLKEVCGGDFELLAECYSGGKSYEEALRLRVERAEQAQAELLAQHKQLQEQ